MGHLSSIACLYCGLYSCIITSMSVPCCWHSLFYLPPVHVMNTSPWSSPALARVLCGECTLGHLTLWPANVVHIHYITLNYSPIRPGQTMEIFTCITNPYGQTRLWKFFSALFPLYLSHTVDSFPSGIFIQYICNTVIWHRIYVAVCLLVWFINPRTTYLFCNVGDSKDFPMSTVLDKFYDRVVTVVI